MVDNSFPYKDAEGNSVVWHDSHWHPNYGGLYRNVYIHVVDPLHLTLPLYSFIQSEGTYVYTSDETATSAKVNIDAQVENNYNTTKTFKLIAYIKDANGNVVGSPIESASQEIESGEKIHILLERTLNNPNRWSTECPYQYTVECAVVLDDIEVDRNETKFGVRTFRNTTDFGFYLNENYIKLTGWGQKATSGWAGLGAAYPDWMQSFTIKLMKEANGNFIRWGHVAGSPAQIKSSDEYGLLVMQPGVDGEGNYEATYTDSVMQIRINAFRDMIIYYRNSPSIIMWEIGNQASSLSTTYFQQLKGIVDTYDYGNRKAEMVNSGTYADTVSTSDRLISIRQANNASRSYIDVAETTQGSGNLSDKTTVEGEYNRYEARRGVWDTFTLGFEHYTSAGASGFTNYTSEMFSKSQVSTFYNMIGSSSHPGGANWIFSDSTSHGRLYQEVARASGEVDATRLPKDAYYVSRVLFSKTPDCHIIGHWNYSVGTTKNIYVVAKGADSVKLYVNDVLKQETTQKTDGYLYTFSNVSYEAGTIKADVIKNGSVVATHSITSHGTPVALKITEVNTQPLYANGSDVLLLDVEVVDSNGNRCVTYDGATIGKFVTFTVNDHEDDASILEENQTSVWRGGYNSNVEKSTNHKYLYMEAGIVRVALRTTRNPGDITVTARLNGFTSATKTVTSEPDYTYVDGLSTDMPTLLSYSYEGVTEYGDGTKLGLEEAVIIDTPPVSGFTSSLIEDIAYTGVHSISLEESLQNNVNVYTDETITFNSVPAELRGAEYILTSNADHDSLNAEIISFTAKKDIEVSIIWDPLVEVPTWLQSFTLDDDIVTTSDGSIYVIYKTNLEAEERLILPSVGVAGLNSRMMIVAIRVASASDYLLNDEFNDCDAETGNPSGWNIRSISNAPITVDTKAKGEDITNTALHLVDNVTGDNNLSYVYKGFPMQTDSVVEVSFDAYISSSQLNNWIRIWLHDGEPSTTPSNKDNVIIETYLHHDKNIAPANNYKLIYRDKASTDSANKLIDNNIEMDTWHSFKYVIDLKAQTYSVQVDNDTAVTGLLFRKISNSMCYINFGTGANSLNNFYIDNVKITPVLVGAISGINIGETAGTLTPMQNFNIYANDYLYEYDTASGSHPVITVTPGELYGEAPTIEYNILYATVSGTDINGAEYCYKVYFSKYNLVSVDVSSNVVESVLCTAQISESISHNKLLATDKNMYIGEGTPTFRSIPHELLNAEYFTLRDNTVLNSGIFKFTTCKDVDMFIFRDSTINDETKLTDYTETNSVVTGSNGHVYIVYKKSIPSGTEVIVSLENEVNNSPSNIIALKESTLVRDKIMQYEDFTTDFTNDMIGKSWSTMKHKASASVDDSLERAYIEEIDGEQVLTLQSETAGSMIFFYKEIPRLYDRYTVTYDAYVDGTDQNKYMRVFLQQGPPIQGSYNAKENVVFESYLHDDSTTKVNGRYANVDMYYRRYILPDGSIPSATLYPEYNGTQNVYIRKNIPTDTWFKYKYDVDMINKRVKVYIYNADTSLLFESGWLGIEEITERDPSPTYTNYVVFASAFNGKSKISFKNMEIEPVARTSVTGIQATDANRNVVDIQNFDPLTNDYLLRISHIDEKPTINLTLKDGTSATVAEPIEHSNYTEITVTDVNDGELDYDTTYRVYFVSVDRSQLLLALNTANALNESDYTVATWEALEATIVDGQIKHDSDTVTQLELNTATENINNAIANLRLDKSSLLTALDRARELIGVLGVNPGYTESTYNDLEVEYEDGLSTYNSESSTKSDITISTSAVNAAIDNLVVDKTALNSKILESNTFYGDGTNTLYTAETWGLFISARTQALNEYNSSTSSIVSIENAKVSLTNAINSLESDVAAPTCNITAVPDGTTNLASVTYTFTFSEDVTGFVVGDITVNNGSKGTFTETTTNRVYTLVVTNTGACTQTVSIAENVCEDAIGNGNEASSKTVTIALTDLVALQASIEIAETKYGDGTNPGYTEATWNTLGTAITEAKAITGRNTTTEVATAKTNVDNAVGSLVVDKARLNTRIEYSRRLGSSNYTEETWNIVQEKLTIAENVYVNESATILEVKTALDNLELALENLENVASNKPKVSKAELRGALRKADKLIQDDYTEKSWEALQKAVEAGDEVRLDSSVTKKQVDNATEKILDAMNNLVIQEKKEEVKETKLFVDIDSHWAEKSIEKMAKKGLFNGVDKDKFGPEIVSTRAMMITVLYRLEQEPEISNSNIFKDVEKGQYYEKATAWGYSSSIVKGVDEKSFAPNDSITREQFVTMMFNYIKYKNIKLITNENVIEKFEDANTISAYAVEPMKWAIENGIVKGRDEKNLAPKATATRAELATLTERLINYIEENNI